MDSATSTSTAGASPFEIPLEHELALCAHPGFQILREYVASNLQGSFCPEHATLPPAERDTHAFHLAVLHSLTMPVVTLLSRARALAAAAACSRRPEDLELAFRGDARSAFVGLSCFAADEADWCRSRGCPACVVHDTLSSDAHVRVALACALLSAAAHRHGDSPASPPSSAIPLAPSPSGLTLPPLPFFPTVLRAALAADPFWGDAYWAHHTQRAEQLAGAVRALIAQCAELEVLVTSPPRSPASPSPSPSPVEASSGGIAVRASGLAKRQARLKVEQREALRRVVAQGGFGGVEAVGFAGGAAGGRRRSLTCP